MKTYSPYIYCITATLTLCAIMHQVAVLKHRSLKGHEIFKHPTTFSCTLVSRKQSIYSITRHPESQSTLMIQKEENVGSADILTDAEVRGEGKGGQDSENPHYLRCKKCTRVLH